VLRTDLSGEPSFRELISRVRETALGAYQHQDVPFEQVVDAVQPERSLGHSPLFQVMFVLNNLRLGELTLPDVRFAPVEVEGGTARFDMTLQVNEQGGRLLGALEFNTDLFDAATVRRLLDSYRVLLDAAVADAEQPVSLLPLLEEAERERLLVTSNATDAAYPLDRRVHDLIAEQAQLRPDAVAIQFDQETLSYAEFDRRATQLAHRLRTHGVGPETLVGLCLERSPDLPVAILAVWKAGGAYLPLDPSYPAERLRFMLEDAGARLLITHSHLQSRLPETDAEVLHLDQLPAEPDPGELLPSGATARSLAYVIYTSGSTGKPKGVMVEHRGAVNLARTLRERMGVGAEDRVLQFSALSFDASVWETVMALANGATLVMARQEVLTSGVELVRLLEAQRISVVTLPPSLLAVLPEAELPELRTLVVAGEACSRALVERWGQGRRFINAYGPTENTVCASWAVCDPSDPAPPPIGRALPNVCLYVLDEQGEPVPVGVPGELWVGGAQVARGYLNRPELTVERFPVDRFAGDGRLYRTGDRVRWRADGQLEFLGRIDEQVKLRGFRIEPGEIESVLRQHPSVSDAAVAVKGERLIGYVVGVEGRGKREEGREEERGARSEERGEKPDEMTAAGATVLPSPPAGEGPGEGGLDPAALRTWLAERLPGHMVPQIVLPVEALPRSPAGKVDRNALPEPEGREAVVAVEYVAPRTETEAQLAALCAELLGLERVGVQDSFFDLGGHSLLATQLVSRIRGHFGVELPLKSLFEQPTVAGLATQVEILQARGDQDQTAGIQRLSRDAHRRKRAGV
jgi:amino acid adenylation domain-containing protein